MLLFQGLSSSLSGNDCCFMVAFQYGSIVLFNVRDHEIDGYLKIVERHASGLLPEMRKDGNHCLQFLIVLYNSLIMMLAIFIPSTCV